MQCCWFCPLLRGIYIALHDWYNNRRAVIILSYGQGDARARPASALMADYTMVMPNGSPLARQLPFDGRLYHAASRTWYNDYSKWHAPCKTPIFMADSSVYVMLLTYKGRFFACFCVYTGMKGRYSKTNKGMY